MNINGGMNKMKKIFSEIGSYLISFFAAMWIGVLAVIILKIPFDMMTDSDILSGRLFQGLLLTFSPAVFLFFAMKKKGYKAAEPNIRETAVCMGVVFLIQQLFSYVIGYAIYISGGAINLAQAIFLKGSAVVYENDTVFPLLASTAQDVPLWSYHLLMLATDIFIIFPAVAAGKNAGVKKRLKERAELNLE